MTDEEITKRIRQRDLEIFDYIMEHYNKLLWVVVGNILEKAGSTQDIEDCISDVYVKLLENPKLYDHKKGSLKSFLVRVGKNLAIDRYRKLKKSKVVPISMQPDIPNEDDLLRSIISQESKEKISEALDGLKEPVREIIVRRYLFGEKVNVISEKMSLQVKDIENKLYDRVSLSPLGVTIHLPRDMSDDYKQCNSVKNLQYFPTHSYQCSPYHHQENG